MGLKPGLLKTIGSPIQDSHWGASTPLCIASAIDHRAPNHISKMVLSTVHFGPREKTRTRRWSADLLWDSPKMRGL